MTSHCFCRDLYSPSILLAILGKGSIPKYTIRNTCKKCPRNYPHNCGSPFHFCSPGCPTLQTKKHLGWQSPDVLLNPETTASHWERKGKDSWVMCIMCICSVVGIWCPGIHRWSIFCSGKISLQPTSPSWWLQLIWKICSSNGIISPRCGNEKYVKPPPSHIFLNSAPIKSATSQLRFRNFGIDLEAWHGQLDFFRVVDLALNESQTLETNI